MGGTQNVCCAYLLSSSVGCSRRVTPLGGVPALHTYCAAQASRAQRCLPTWAYPVGPSGFFIK